MAPRRDASANPASASSGGSSGNRWRSGAKRSDQQPPSLNLQAEEWPPSIPISTTCRPGCEDLMEIHKTHGLCRFMELYSENSIADYICSLPVIEFLDTLTGKALSEYLATKVLPVTALIPVATLLGCALSDDFKENEFAGMILTTLFMVLYGFNDTQLHYLYYTFFETGPDEILRDNFGISPMQWLSQSFYTVQDGVKTNSTVDAHGSTIKDFDCSNAALIFQHCKSLNPAWQHPEHQDFAAQGRPTTWNDKFHISYRKDMYDILSLMPEKEWMSTSIQYDTREKIFTDRSITKMLGHLGVELYATQANFPASWHFYAFLAARPNKHGITIKDLELISRDVDTVLPKKNDGSPNLNPILSLRHALEATARHISEKGGITNTSDSSLGPQTLASQAWKSNVLTPFYGVSVWPCVADVTRALYTVNHPGVHPLFYRVVKKNSAMTLLDRLGVHSTIIAQPKLADRYHISDPILESDAPAASTAPTYSANPADCFRRYEVDMSRGGTVRESTNMDAFHMGVPISCFPISQSAISEKVPRAVRAGWMAAKQGSEYPYLLNGLKMTALSSILFHKRLKASDDKTPFRGESASEDGSAIVYGFDHFTESLVSWYGTWSYLGNGFYYNVFCELHPKSDIKSLKRDQQKYISEDHTIGWIFLSIVHVNSIRAYRPVSFAVIVPRRVAKNEKARNSFYQNGQAVRFPVEHEATPIDFTLVYTSLWESMKRKLSAGKEFGASFMNALTCGIFGSSGSKTISTVGTDASDSTQPGIVVARPPPPEIPGHPQQQGQSMGHEDNRPFLLGSNAPRIRDPRPAPRLRYLVGKPEAGAGVNDEGWDFQMGDDATGKTRNDTIRTCELRLDRAARNKIVELTSTEPQSAAKSGANSTMIDGGITAAARDHYSLWSVHCSNMLRFITKIQPHRFPEDIMNKLCGMYASPRVYIACLIALGDRPGAGKLLRGLLNGNQPPDAVFASSADTTILADSSMDLTFSAKSAPIESDFVKALPNIKVSNSRGAKQTMTFSHITSHILCGGWPNDYEKAVEDHNEVLHEEHWKSLLTQDRNARSSDHRHGQSYYIDDRTWGIAYRGDYFPFFAKTNSPCGNFEGKSSQRVRTRVRTGATLPDLALMADEVRAEILAELTTGRPLRVNRCCIICYTLNDIVKGANNQYIIDSSHWDSDLKLFLEDLILTAQRTWGDNVAFVTGLDSDLLYREKLHNYDTLQAKVVDHLRSRGIMTINLAEHWQGLEFRDPWHLAQNCRNTYKMAELLNAIALTLSWRSHNSVKNFNDFEYGDHTTCDSGGYLNCPIPTGSKIELAKEVPFSNIPVSNADIERFLGTQLWEAVRGGEVSLHRMVADDCGGAEDPLGDFGPDPGLTEAEIDNDEQDASLPEPDSTGEGASSTPSYAEILTQKSQDREIANPSAKGPHRPEALLAAGKIRDGPDVKEDAKAKSTAGASASSSQQDFPPLPSRADAKASSTAGASTSSSQEPFPPLPPRTADRIPKAPPGVNVPPPPPPPRRPEPKSMPPKGSGKGKGAKASSPASARSVADVDKELNDLKPAISKISKEWNNWFKSTTIQGEINMDGDPYQLEDILSSFLWEKGRRGRGKRTQYRYDGPRYDLPYRGILFLIRLGLDLGNVVFEDQQVVPGFITAGCSMEFVNILVAIAMILHPDLIHFISWGVAWQQIIRNLAAFNFRYSLYTRKQGVDARHWKNVPDPRFHPGLYALFNYTRGCQGSIVLPPRNDPTTFIGETEHEAWMEGPEIVHNEIGAIGVPIPEPVIPVRSHHTILGGFHKFDRRWKTYNFLGSESKRGDFKKPDEEVGKLVCMRKHGTDVFIDDDAGQCGYLDCTRRRGVDSHAVSPIHSQRAACRDGSGYYKVESNDKYLGRTASSPTASLKIYIEYCLYAIGQNIRNGHLDLKKMFPPDWEDRATLKTGGTYPSAFGIDADRGILAEHIGIPMPTEDGEFVDGWWRDNTLLRRCLNPTQDMKKLYDLIEALVKEKNGLIGTEGPDAPGDGLFEDAPQTLGDLAGKQTAPSQGTQPSSTGGAGAATEPTPANAEIQIADELGFCVGCNVKMTKAEHNDHVCSEPDAPNKDWCPMSQAASTILAKSTGESSGGGTRTDADQDADMAIDDDDSIPEASFGDAGSVWQQHECQILEDDRVIEYKFDSHRIIINRNEDEEMNEEDFVSQVTKEPVSKRIFEHQSYRCCYPVSYRTMVQTLLQSLEQHNIAHPDHHLGFLPQNNYPICWEEGYLSGNKYFMFDSKLSAPSERKLYLFAAGDVRGLFKSRYACVMQDIPTDFLLGKIHSVQYSLNYTCLLVSAPKPADIVEAGIHVYKPFLKAYARGYITHLWVIVWSSHDMDGNPLGRPRGMVGTYDEVETRMNSMGNSIPLGRPDPEKDGMTVTRRSSMKTILREIDVDIHGSIQADPYLKFGDYTKKKTSGEEIPFNPWELLDDDPAKQKSTDEEEKKDKSAEKGETEDTESDEYSEWRARKSPLVTRGLPENVNLAVALELCKDEFDRINDPSLENEPYPPLATQFFRYKAVIVAEKCPYYYQEFDPNQDFAKQLWFNTAGDVIREIRNKDPNGPDKIQFRDGINSKLIKGESCWIKELMPPRKHFQACVTDRTIDIIDVSDRKSYPMCDPIINAWRSSVPLYEGGKPDRQRRFILLEPSLGPLLIDAVKKTPVGELYKQMFKSGLPKQLTAESTSMSEEEVALIERTLGNAFRDRRSRKAKQSFAAARMEVNSIAEDYLRAFDTIDHDDRLRGEDWMLVISCVVKRFFWQNLFNSVDIPQRFENIRKSSVIRKCEETNSVVYNVVEIHELMDFTRYKASQFHGRDTGQVLRCANPILQGHDEYTKPGYACWIKIEDFMRTLCSRLAACHDPEATDITYASRNTVCPIHLLIDSLAKDRSNAFELRVQLCMEPTAEDPSLSEPPRGQGQVRYYMPVASGVDVAIEVAEPDLHDASLERFIAVVLRLKDGEFPKQWDTIFSLDSRNGLARDREARFSRRVRVTHIRRVHGLNKDLTEMEKPNHWFQFNQSFNACGYSGKNRQVDVARRADDIPEYLYYTTRKENLKFIASQGFILSNPCYPVSGDIPPDPDQMKVPIVCSTIPTWAGDDKICPGPESRVWYRDGATIVIHARASFLEGWPWILGDRGLWSTNHAIASGYIVGVLQSLPFYRILYWRPFIITGFDYTRARQYAYIRDGKYFFHAAQARGDKRLPTDKCTCCGAIQFYGSPYCAECQSPMFAGGWISSKFLPPPAMFQLSYLSSERWTIANYMRDMCGDGNHWGQEHYCWHVAPMYDVKLEAVDYTMDDPDTADELKRCIENFKKEFVRYRGGHDYYSSWLRQAQSMGVWLQFCNIGSVFASTIHSSLSKGYSVESPTRLRQYIDTARKFVEDNFDLNVITTRQEDNRGRATYDRVKWMQSPFTRAINIDTKEVKHIHFNVTKLLENPNLTADSSSITRVGFALGQFTSVVDRIYRDTVFRIRLHKAWLDQHSRMDQDFIRFSVFHFLAHSIEKKIAKATASLTAAEAESKVVVPFFDKDLQLVRTHESDNRDHSLMTLRGNFEALEGWAQVDVIDRDELRDFLCNYEYCVPTTENEDKRRKFRLEKVLTESVPEASDIKPNSTGDIADDADIEDDDNDLPSKPKGILDDIHEYMTENACCRCGTRHPVSGKVRYLQCEECFSACCNNERCVNLPCRGRYELVALKMQAMSLRPGVPEFAPAKYDAAEHKRRIVDVAAEAKSSLGSSAKRPQRDDRGPSTAGSKPRHKQVNPETGEFYNFSNMEQAPSASSGKAKGSGKSSSTDANVPVPQASDYSTDAPILSHSLDVGAPLQKGSGKRARSAGGSDDQRPPKASKGKGKQHQKTKPAIDWDAREQQRQENLRQLQERAERGEFDDSLIPNEAEESNSASSSTAGAVPAPKPSAIPPSAAPGWKPTLFFRPSVTKLSSDAGSSRVSSVVPVDDRSVDLHQMISSATRRPGTRDIRKEYAPSDVVQLSDVRTGQPASTGARATGSHRRAARPTSSVGGSEVIQFNAPNIAASSIPDNSSVGSNTLQDLHEIDDYREDTDEERDMEVDDQ